MKTSIFVTRSATDAPATTRESTILRRLSAARTGEGGSNFRSYKITKPASRRKSCGRDMILGVGGEGTKGISTRT